MIATTTDELVESKIAEIEEILDDYDVMAHDVETVVGIVEHIGTLLADACKTGRQYEAFVFDELGEEGVKKFIRIITGKEKPGEHLKGEC